MKKAIYKVNEFRRKLSEALNEAERGKEVYIVRDGNEFLLRHNRSREEKGEEGEEIDNYFKEEREKVWGRYGGSNLILLEELVNGGMTWKNSRRACNFLKLTEEEVWIIGARYCGYGRYEEALRDEKLREIREGREGGKGEEISSAGCDNRAL